MHNEDPNRPRNNFYSDQRAFRHRPGSTIFPGTQIAYVPLHAGDGNLSHPDVEFGFVTSQASDGTSHFCRYWTKRSTMTHLELRTLSNSERTPDDRLWIVATVPESLIDDAYRLIVSQER